jgi:hypothetical protein
MKWTNPFSSKSDVDSQLDEYFKVEKARRESDLETEMLQLKAKYEIQCAKDWQNYEHEFHFGKEERGIQLAKLDAEIELKEQLRKVHELVLTEKDKTIALLTELVTTLSKGCVCSCEKTE